MHFLTRSHLSRRAMLRGAGAALALPLLESMMPAGVARAASASAAQLRLGCVYVPHGAVMSQWTPATDGQGLRILRDPEAARSRSATG